MNVLILGAGGFLGQAVAARLLKEGHDVTCIVRSRRPRQTRGIHYIEAALNETTAFLSAAEGADFILHFAWDTTPGASKEQPTIEVVDNLLPTLRLLEALHGRNGAPLIFVSSAGAVYGANGRAHESSPVMPHSYYGAAKVALEIFLQAYTAQTDNPVVVVRPSNVYGPGQAPKRQFGIVPTVLRALRDDTKFCVWGDGEVRRDYLYIDDFAELFVQLLRRQWQGFHLFNVASGATCTINELYRLLETISGKTLSVEYLPDRGVDQPGAAIDCSKAQRELGWQASKSLEQGLLDTWRWFLSQDDI